MNADRSNLKRTTALVQDLRRIAQAIRICGWDDRLCDEASRIKRRARFGGLISWADGWVRKEADMPVGNRILKKIHSEQVRSPNRLLATGLVRARILLNEVINSQTPENKAPLGNDAFSLTFRASHPPGGRPRARTVAGDLDTVADVIASAAEATDPAASSGPAAGVSDAGLAVDTWPCAAEAARRLGLSKGHITRLCQEGKLDSRKRGATRRVNPASVIQYAKIRKIVLGEAYLKEMQQLVQTMGQLQARSVARGLR